MLKNYQLPQKYLIFLISILLILGIFFRFANISQKLFNGDECITTVRIAGFRHQEVNNLIPRNQVISPEDIKKFQFVKDSEKNLINTVEVTAEMAPQHTPLYFILARVWVQIFGDSVIAIRTLSALISLLCFPAIYWLCLELFKSPTVGWVAVALMTVSPIHIIQAQNSRPYSLWILTILLSSIFFLRAIRQNKKSSWFLYGISLSLSLYTFLFSWFVFIAHTIYIFAIESFRRTKTLINYLITSLLVAISFIPWLLIVIANFNTANQMTSWTGKPASFLRLVQAWLKNLCDIFIFWHSEFQNKLLISESIFTWVVGICLLTLLLYAFYLLYKQTPKTVWLFVFTLTGACSLALVSADLLLEGRRSALSRYLFPSVLGIQLAFAYLLGNKITCLSLNSTVRKIWQIITVIIISAGVLSNTFSSQTESWNGLNDFIIQSSGIINQAENPLVISDGDIIFGIMPLNFRLDSHVRLYLISDSTEKAIPNNYSDVFLWNSSKELRSQLEKQFELKPVFQDYKREGTIWENSSPATLWKL
ncbi:MAG: glycosyltransferase family 39 protein [Rivularia sp. (in: Bacteria)]|nr:glycosyltransferase family 39 protein [Rivularia sp. MS3]